MDENKKYFLYLQNRSLFGRLYRQYYLYPRLLRNLKGRLLDVGCGIGDMLTFRPNTVGVDVNPYNVNFCKALGCEAYVMSVDELPFDNSSFDSVLLDNVLEHISDPVPLLKEIQRVIRPNGFLLIGVPGLRGQNSDSDHKVYYDESTLISLANQLGFKVNSLMHTPFWKSALLSRTLKQYCIYSQWQTRP
jgi:SAM-dependent methyltransferase